MPETIEDKHFDSIAYMNERNVQEQAAKEGKPLPEKPKVEAKVEAPAVEKDDDQPHISRSARRQINRAREEAAELRGRLSVMEEMLKGRNTEPEKPKEDDPKPDGADIGALARWEARQEARKEVAKRDEKSESEQQISEYRQQLAEADKKAAEDLKLIPDWKEASAAAIKAAEEAEENDEDYPMIEQGSQLWAMLAVSDMQAFVLYHFAKHPEDLQAMIDLGSTGKQVERFKRLEGRLEVLYSKEQKKEAAQASADKPAKDRTHPAEEQSGRTTSERDVRKAKPSSEVSAKGGSAPPEEPKIGSPAWMEMRNRMQYGERR